MNKYIELEYKTMREEVKMTFNHIFLTMQMSLAFISGLLIVAFNNLSNILLANMILCILVPMVCATALSFMLSESIRMQRAGIYMCILEKKCTLYSCIQTESTLISLHNVEQKHIGISTNINLAAPLCFEHWIRDNNLKSKSIFGRASFMLQFRFIFFFLIGVGIFFFSTAYQFYVSDKAVWIPSHYIFHLIGVVLSVPWFLIIINYGLILNETTKFKRYTIIAFLFIVSLLIVFSFVYLASTNQFELLSLL